MRYVIKLKKFVNFSAKDKFREVNFTETVTVMLKLPKILNIWKFLAVQDFLCCVILNLPSVQSTRWYY